MFLFLFDKKCINITICILMVYFCIKAIWIFQTSQLLSYVIPVILFLTYCCGN